MEGVSKQDQGSSQGRGAIRLTIPLAVVEHWSDRLDEIARLGERQATDRTYAKVVAARSARPVRIVADCADIAELNEEVSSWLDCETDVSVGRDPEDRRIRAGYRRLARALGAACQYPKPAFVGMYDIDGDLHVRAPEEHAYEARQCTWRDLFWMKGGQTLPAETLEDIDAYLEPFAAPIMIDGKNMCPHCGHSFNGSLLHSLVGEAGFTWGLVHGEGHCKCCSWPARLYHSVKDRHGAELMTFRHVVLAYRPLTPEEVAQQTGASGSADKREGAAQ